MESLHNELPQEIELPARRESIAALVDFVTAHARETAFEEKAVQDIGLAAEEALMNIVTHSCHSADCMIRIGVAVHESGTLIFSIIDTGKPFNMLLEAFPEANPGTDPGQLPSTKMMKKAIKNIEYKRAPDKNILVFTIPRLLYR